MARRKPNSKKEKKKEKDQEKEPWTYKSWYDDNKEELAKRRKDRYKNDPDYKERVLEQNKKHREAKKKEAAKKPKPKVRIPRNRKPVMLIILLDGNPTAKELVHIGAFSRAIGKSIPTVHQWERNGLLPRTPLFMNGSAKRERLFTSEMIAVVKVEIEKRSGRVSSKDSSFYKDVTGGWLKAGVNLETTKVLGEVSDG